MQRSKLVGFALLGLLAMMTNLATSAALEAKKKSDSARTTTPFSENLPAPIAHIGPVPSSPAIDNPHTLGSGAMGPLNVAAIGRELRIAAEVSLMNRRPGLTYLWTVRVIDVQSKQVVWRKAYDDQVFSIPLNVRVFPTFRDRLTLPLGPGRYVAQVTVYEVYPGKGLDVLIDNEVAEGYEACRGGRKFEIH